MEELQNGQKAMEISTETPISITLTALEWSSILYGIDELPRKTAQPLFDKINGALVNAAQQLQPKEDSDEKGDEKVEGKKSKGKQPRKQAS